MESSSKIQNSLYLDSTHSKVHDLCLVFNLLKSILYLSNNACKVTI